MAPTRPELDSKYNPHGLENKWYPLWEKGGYFSWKKQSNGDKELSPEEGRQLHQQGKTFSMVIPPPNVTGSLHLGHALNHTIQDILARAHRMKGELTLWLPGTDHAGIATQNVVERLLKKEDKNRWDLGREKFAERVWEWKAESGGMITHQQRELGESVDWNYERFTLDDGLSETVKDVFVELYREGLIYQGERIINWCPHCVTALSNIEVEYQDRKGKLYHIKYPLAETQEEAQQALENGDYLLVATTRPETMLGDEALAVHPEDERYSAHVGKKAWLPLVGKAIPVVGDDFVDREFGTGVVKVTPAHDPNDFEVGRRHDLPITRILDDHGKINEKAGRFEGLSREKARDMVLAELEEQGYLHETEDHKHAVGECYRCSTIVEPIASLQWFVKVKPLAEKAIEVVKDGSIEFVPKRWENTYFEWMYNIQDWCISRQLWWGHRIPAYKCLSCGEIHVEKETPEVCGKCGHKELKQDEDVLDTWFSSALWPFSTMLTPQEAQNTNEWPANNLELSLFYPTRVLVTGFDIIFFWVARMIMMGMHFMKEVPFEKVYIHGLVRDADRAKMSKSKGNVINPLEKMQEYGTDAFRFFLISILPEGKDIIYDESRLKGYSAFCNKIWNTARFIQMNLEPGYELPEKLPSDIGDAGNWIIDRFNKTLEKTNDALKHMRFADYAQSVYDFIWKEFCDNYIELSKTSLKNPQEAEATRAVLNTVFIDALKLLHPVMPFITEELYNHWYPDEKDLILTSHWPEALSLRNPDGVKNTEIILDVVYRIRNLRGELALPPGDKLDATAVTENEETREVLQRAQAHIENLARLSSLQVSAEPAAGIGAHFSGGSIYLDVADKIDAEKEKARLAKEVANLEKYVSSIDKKLNNPGFVKNAPPELLEEETQKKQNTGERLKQLQELLKAL